MRQYLLPKAGQFYKANLHCHTNISDGGMTPLEVKERYVKKGYSVVAYTDHDVMVPHPELCDENFLALNGYEMEINEEIDREFQFKKACHMCLVALSPDNLNQVCFHRSKYLVGNGEKYLDQIQYDENEPDYEREYTHACISDMMRRGRENGFFVTYNHPGWSMENYSDYMGYDFMHAMEIYNSESGANGYCSYAEREYDDMLRGGKRIYCIATDDNHGEKGSFGGFVMIKAPKLEYETITDALVSGNFYASQGPEIYDLWYEDGRIHIKCSPVKQIVLHTGNRRIENLSWLDGTLVNEAEFSVLPDDDYVRITITDGCGKHANTSAYFVDQLGL